METDIQLSLTDLITHVQGCGIAVDMEQRSDVIRLTLNGVQIFETFGTVGYKLTQTFLYGMLVAGMNYNQEEL